MNKLTVREKQILELVANGDKNKDIAKNLFLSSCTIRNHIANIFIKLSVNNRVQATRIYLTGDTNAD